MKIVATIISIVFLCNTSLYSCPVSKDSLRPPLQSDTDMFDGAIEALGGKSVTDLSGHSSADRVITDKEHEIIREVLREMDARNDSNRDEDLERAFEAYGIKLPLDYYGKSKGAEGADLLDDWDNQELVRELMEKGEVPKIRVVKGMAEAIQEEFIKDGLDTDRKIVGHWAFRDGFIYIDADVADLFYYAVHEATELIDARMLALRRSQSFEQAVTRLDKTGDEDEVRRELEGIHAAAPPLPGKPAEVVSPGRAVRPGAGEESFSRNLAQIKGVVEKVSNLVSKSERRMGVTSEEVREILSEVEGARLIVIGELISFFQGDYYSFKGEVHPVSVLTGKMAEIVFCLKGASTEKDKDEVRRILITVKLILPDINTAIASLESWQSRAARSGAAETLRELKEDKEGLQNLLTMSDHEWDNNPLLLEILEKYHIRSIKDIRLAIETISQQIEEETGRAVRGAALVQAEEIVYDNDGQPTGGVHQRDYISPAKKVASDTADVLLDGVLTEQDNFDFTVRTLSALQAISDGDHQRIEFEWNGDIEPARERVERWLNHNQDLVEIGGLPIDAIKPTPKITIVVTSYNQLIYLKECLESLWQQSLYQRGEMEIIVIDDASNDGTQAYLDEVGDKLRWIKLKRNLGSPGFNRDIALYYSDPRAPYMKYVDGDDYLSDRHSAETLVDAIESQPPEIKMVYALSETIDRNGRLAPELSAHCDNICRTLLQKGIAPHIYGLFTGPFNNGTVILRKDTWNELGGFGKLRRGEDGSLFSRIALRYGLDCFYFTDRVVYRYRRYVDSLHLSDFSDFENLSDDGVTSHLRMLWRVALMRAEEIGYFPHILLVGEQPSELLEIGREIFKEGFYVTIALRTTRGTYLRHFLTPVVFGKAARSLGPRFLETRSSEVLTLEELLVDSEPIRLVVDCTDGDLSDQDSSLHKANIPMVCLNDLRSSSHIDSDTPDRLEDAIGKVVKRVAVDRRASTDDTQTADNIDEDTMKEGFRQFGLILSSPEWQTTIFPRIFQYAYPIQWNPRLERDMLQQYPYLYTLTTERDLIRWLEGRQNLPFQSSLLGDVGLFFTDPLFTIEDMGWICMERGEKYVLLVFDTKEILANTELWRKCISTDPETHTAHRWTFCTFSSVSTEWLKRTIPATEIGRLEPKESSHTRRQHVDSMDKIIAVPASEIIGNEDAFMNWLSKQPENVAVEIIARGRDEYDKIVKFNKVAWLKIVPTEGDNLEGIDPIDIMDVTLDDVERAFAIFEDTDLFMGFNAGKLDVDRDKALIEALASGV